jgi:RNA polymerase sigma-70 factor (ECF subfamily)
LIRDERQRALRCALAELPTETRDLIWLHYFEGLRFREIAAITGMHPTTVKVRVHRARRALRRRLALLLDDEAAEPAEIPGREAQT